MMRIILSGGGTLGSVTPLIAVWQELKIKTDVDALWVGTRQGPEKEFVSSYGMEFRGIISVKLRRAFDLRNFFIPFLLFVGYIQSFFVLSKFKPAAVISAGGFVSVPLVWVAWILGVPVYLHQEDLKIGLANLLMAPFTRVVTTAFSETAKRFPHPRVRCIGNPVRKEIEASVFIKKEEALAHFGFDFGKPVLLILGGGTGALSLNSAVMENKEELLRFFNLIHLTGKGKGEAHKEAGYFGAEFLGREELPLAFAAADLAFSRAGMGTISELAAVGLPVILVPIRRSHQEDNAAYFSASGAAFVLKQNDVDSGAFVAELKRFSEDKAMLNELKTNMKKIFPAGAAEEAVRIWFPDVGVKN